MRKEHIERYFFARIDAHLECINLIREDRGLLESLGRAAGMTAESLRLGGKLLLCGNGGSAADAQHMAAEFVGRFLRERKPLCAEALTTNTSSILAIGNDYGFEDIFLRQLEAQGKKGDVLIGLSTSGNSPNVVRAMRRARELGIGTIGFSGERRGAAIEDASDILLAVPSRETPRIQEAHILLAHMLCEYADDLLFGSRSA